MSEFRLNTGRYIEENIEISNDENWIMVYATHCEGPLLTRLKIGLKPNQAREVAAALLAAAESTEAQRKGV